jgi:hypothetical protein
MNPRIKTHVHIHDYLAITLESVMTFAFLEQGVIASALELEEMSFAFLELGDITG